MKFIFFLLFILPELSFSQTNSVWLVTKIDCDTCEFNKCDTLIYLEKKNYEACSFIKDTLKCTYNFVRFNHNGKALNKCSRTMIDSTKSKQMYFVVYEDDYYWYEEITETNNYELRKIFHEKDSLKHVDSLLLRRKKPFIRYSTKYYENKPMTSTTTKYKYHINGKLQKTIYEAYNVKYISFFNFKGKEKLRKYFQKGDNTWLLQEETTVKHLGKNHYKETTTDYLSNDRRTYERYEPIPEYTKTIIIVDCHEEQIVRAKLY